MPFALAPGRVAHRSSLRLAWYVGATDLRVGQGPAAVPPGGPARRSSRGTPAASPGIDEVAAYWAAQYDELRRASTRFSDCFYDTTLPPEVVEAVAANLTILKSPTVLRQADGRLWCWEGCSDGSGCCRGSCTHVWNYAQALPHLFPALERTLRETEFGVSQDERGPPGLPRGAAHPAGRARLPRRRRRAAGRHHEGLPRVAHQRRHRVAAAPVAEGAAAAWTTASRPGTRAARASSRSRTTTRTTSSSGARTACAPASTSARWRRPSRMGKALGRGRRGLRGAARQGHGARRRRELFDGEYFVQKHPVGGPAREEPARDRELRRRATRREAVELLKKEGPKYQYGTGCLSDGVLGAWMAAVCGVPRGARSGEGGEPPAGGAPLQPQEATCPRTPTRSARRTRCGDEGGLLLCTWPKGGKLSLPFVYSDEVWTGIEYQVASHLMLMGLRGRGAGDRARRAATGTTGACATRSTSTSAATGTRGRCRPTACCRA